MGRAAESVHVAASEADAWSVYFDPGTWPAWVDGFGQVEGSEGYPEPGGTLRWRSVPAGRGVVEERVLEHEPPRRHRIAFSDSYSEGELETRFEPADGGTRIAQEVTYRLRRRGPLTWLTDMLFVRSQMQRSLARSLEHLRSEVEERASGPPV